MTPEHRRAWLFLAVGLVAASQSGNLIRLSSAHPASIAAWRLAIAACLLAPLAGRDLFAIARLSGRDRARLAIAGAALASHLLLWVAAVQRTTVANAAIFFSVNPVITATAARLWFGERTTPRLGASIALGLAGVAVIGLCDLSFSASHLDGDLLSVACSFAFSAYFLLGKSLRQVLSSGAYVTALYGIAAACAFIVAAAAGAPLLDHTPRDWLAFTLLALVPTMTGHTSFNHALRWIEASRISTLTLSEPLMAGAVAAIAWGEPLTIRAVAGYALICGSVIVLAFDRQRGGARAPREWRNE